MPIMKSIIYFTLAAALTIGAHGVPTVGHRHEVAHAKLHHKRSIDWVTEYEVVTVTVIDTVYADTIEPTASAEAATSDAPAAVTVSASSESAQIISTLQAASPTSSLAAVTDTTPSAASSTETASATSAASSPASSAAAVGSTFAGDGSTSAGASYTGDFTWYDPGLGACGITSTSDQAIVAISHVLFDPSTPNGNPNNNPLCGRTLDLVGKDGTTYTATVVDRCVGCAESDLDLTISTLR